MAKLILRYPDGVPGAALLLMRLSGAMLVFPALSRMCPPATWLSPTLSGVFILALVAGFGTRPAALLLALALVAAIGSAAVETALLLLAAAGNAGALVLLGPGAWSLDAHRYGRRVIRLEPRPPNRGSTE